MLPVCIKGKSWSRRGLFCALTQAGTLLAASTLKAEPNHLELDLPTLRYAGNWQPHRAVMQSLGSQLRLRTRINAKRTPSVVNIERRAPLFDTPFLYVAGDQALPPLSAEQASDLRRFVDFGGLLVFDDATGGIHQAFQESVKAWVKQLLPSSTLAPLPNDHVLFRSFYLVKQPSGRRTVSDHCLAVQEEGRIKILYLPNDLGGALSRNAQGYALPCVPGGDLQREWALRFAVNLLLYATCTDYKSDPAHVQTLLRRRQWQ